MPPHLLLDLTVQQLGDYGYHSDSGRFCSQGNLFSDFKSRIPGADITPRQNGVTPWGSVMSLPNNPAFNSLLAPLVPHNINAYLIPYVVQYGQGESLYVHNLVFKI